jgi:hypothetical protein
MIPDTQLSEWEELAKRATKGPWKATLSDGRGTLAVLSGTTWICGELHNNFAMPLQEAVANADFIAIGPDNFLALIADLRDARAENERLSKECQYRAKLVEQAVSVISDATDAEQTVRAENERLRERLKPIVDCYGLGNTPEKFVEQVHDFIMEAREELKRTP